jgi:hypothetical protein
MMTFLVLAFIGMMVAAVLFVVMLPLMIIGGVFRLLTLPFRLLFLPFRMLFWPFRRGPMFYGPGCGWGGPRWRRRGAYARW